MLDACKELDDWNSSDDHIYKVIEKAKPLSIKKVLEIDLKRIGVSGVLCKLLLSFAFFFLF